jgi:hypothetical protein
MTLMIYGSMIDVPNPAIITEPWLKPMTIQKGLELPLNFLMGILSVCGMIFSIIYNSHGLTSLPYEIFSATPRNFNPRHEDVAGRLSHIQEEIQRLHALPKLTKNQQKLLEKLNEDETVFTHRVRMDQSLEEVETMHKSGFVTKALIVTIKKAVLVHCLNNHLVGNRISLCYRISSYIDFHFCIYSG